MVNLHTVNPSFFNLAAESLATQWNKDMRAPPKNKSKNKRKNPTQYLQIGPTGLLSQSPSDM